MVQKQEQFNELQKKNLDAAMRLAQLSIENSQRIVELQVETAKALFEEGVQNAQALSSVKDPKDVMDLRTQFAQSTTEKMLGCARKIAEITTETQAEFGRMVGQHLSSGSKDVMESMQKMLTGMPVGSHNAGDAIQNAMETARNAFEQITQASTQAFSNFGALANTAASKAASAAKKK